MKRLLALILGFVCLGGPLFAAQRFGRPIISLENPKDYQYYKLDDVKFPMLSSSNYSVSCLVYRGSEYYYVEVGIENRTANPVTISPDFLDFDKPGYTVFRTDSRVVASELAGVANVRFVPTPPPQMPPSSTITTAVNANATTYGDMTQINGTATSTKTDTSGQAGANFGNALGNAIAARRFYRARRDAVSLAQYLAALGWGDAPEVLGAGKTRLIMMTFSQVKRKKAHFQVVIHLGGESFTFKYKE